MDNLDVIDPKELIDLAEQEAKTFVRKDLKMNQLRNFFDLVDQIRQYHERFRVLNDSEADQKEKERLKKVIKRDLVLLKPKLAFAAGRQSKMKHFKNFIDQAIDATIKADSFINAAENFITLMESLVAYHKFYQNTQSKSFQNDRSSRK